LAWANGSVLNYTVIHQAVCYKPDKNGSSEVFLLTYHISKHRFLTENRV